MEQPGMFMDAMQRKRPLPPAAETLGFELLDVGPAAGTIEIAFAVTPSFTNPFGEVLGGFLAAMLYDTVGPALLATLGPGEFIETDDLRVTFVRPAAVGRILGRGRVVRRDGDRAELEATLFDPEGQRVAHGEATARVVRRPVPAT